MVEGKVELVAEAHGKNLDRFTLRVRAGDVAAGRVNVFGVAAGIPHAGEEMVLIPADGAGLLEARGQGGHIAVRKIDGFAVRREGQRVGAVFAAAASFTEILEIVELIVAVGVAEAPNTLLGRHLVDHHVEAVEGIKEPVCAHGGRGGTAGGLRAFRGRARFGSGGKRDRRQSDGEFFNLGAGARADRRRGDPVEPAVLVAGGDPALGVNGERDPRTLLFLWHRVEQLHFEPGGHLDGRGGGRLGEGSEFGAGGCGGRSRFGFALGFFVGRLGGERDRGKAQEEQRAEAGAAMVEQAGGDHDLGK